MKDWEFYKNKKVAVVGASGYIGSLLCPKLKQAGAEVLSYKKSDGDISQGEFWRKLFSQNVDMVFHLAAYEAREPDVNLDLQINAGSVLACLEAAKNLETKPAIVFSSSSNLAGQAEKLPVNEQTPDRPQTIYAIHKLLAEKYLQYYKDHFNISSITLRLANVYGPSANVELSNRVVLNKIVAAAAAGKDLQLFSNSEKIRDFVHIQDVLNAFMLAGEFAKKSREKFYVIGSGEKTSFKEIAENVLAIAKKAMGKNLQINQSAAVLPAVEMREFVADSSAFKKLTGWMIAIKLGEGLASTFEYFKKNS